MAREYLGDTLDIHAGGVDHIPIHHTNEIAQSEGANGCPFANIWLHAEFMMVDGAKMSKSKGNFYTLSDIIERGFNPLAYRMLSIQGHYRSETNFTWDNLTAAAQRYERILGLAEQRWQLHEAGDEHGLAELFEAATNQMLEAMQQDIATPQALEALSAPLDAVEKHGLCKENVQSFIELLQMADRLLGLNIIELTPDISDDEKELITKRGAARAEKDWATADQVRDELSKANIEVLDLARPGQSARWMRAQHLAV